MSYPWKGEAKPMSPGAFAKAAKLIGCEEAAIRAVWQVEATGREFLSDGSVIRRFEPHHMPGSRMNWRDSLKIKSSRRESMFLDAYRKTPEAALRATSFGGPQIMGFNHEAAGFDTATDMVKAMAQSADNQLDAFVSLIQSWGIASTLRSHEWEAFANRYNGSGQAPVYGRKIEAAYRRVSDGKKSATVLRVGSRGSAVRELQRALGIADDGVFGPETHQRVEEFQVSEGLTVDGIVGNETWTRLKSKVGAKPELQSTPIDDITDKVKTLSGVAAGGSGVAVIANQVKDVLPDGAFTVLTYGVVALALLWAGSIVLRSVRKSF
jgi:hypothetical protein